MKDLFADIPEAIINVQEVIDKIETYKLAREVLLPKFDIPEEFVVAEDEADGGKRGENKFLRHLTYVGAEKRYGNLLQTSLNVWILSWLPSKKRGIQVIF